MEKILVTGACGQIGTVLTKELRKIFGDNQVIASDIKKSDKEIEPYVFLDIVNEQRIVEIIHDYKITQIYHLAAILSASGEWNPLKTWNVNLNGLLSILRIAKDENISKVFFPSTIAVFGKTTPRINTQQNVPLLPETVYGMSKVSGELWCNYVNKRYNIDVRSLRYPGIIGHGTIPHGGTTDYAVEIFHELIKNGNYTCFLKADTRLPMMYIPDAIRATIELMEAPQERIKNRAGYNLSAMSFTPEELFHEIKMHLENVSINYEPDFRQEIAAGWTENIDDSTAREDWAWQHEYDLKKMTEDMILHIRPQYK